MRNKVICVLPVKSTSTRLPSKNFLLLGKKPLWKWTLDSAIESRQFDSVIISTDRPSLFEGYSLPTNVLIHKRDENLCANSVHSLRVVLEVCQRYQPNLPANTIIFMALVTSPFRSPATFASAVNTCISKNKSVVGVTKANKGSNSYRQRDRESGLIVTPSIKDLNRQSTDIDEFLVTGSVFASPLEKLIKYNSFHQPDSLFLELDELESIDINSQLDFMFSQFLLDNNFTPEP